MKTNGSRMVVSGKESLPNFQSTLVDTVDHTFIKFKASTTRSKLNYYRIKRLFDFTGSILFLLLFSPLFLLIAFAIVLDSPGSVFFCQTRVGARRVNGRNNDIWEPCPFTCLKFRTMKQNADQALHRNYIKAFINNNPKQMTHCQGHDTQVKKLVHDPRITRVGRVLRKCSMDELPQLINVLKGEMSLVGPRPAIPYEVEEYDPWHHYRLNGKPGITGLWQVTARSSSNFDEMVLLDIKYLQEQTCWLDLLILMKTPAVVIKCVGAM